MSKITQKWCSKWMKPEAHRTSNLTFRNPPLQPKWMHNSMSQRDGNKLEGHAGKWNSSQEFQVFSESSTVGKFLLLVRAMTRRAAVDHLSRSSQL